MIDAPTNLTRNILIGMFAGFVVGADGELVAAGHPDKIGVSKIVGELLSAKS